MAVLENRNNTRAILDAIGVDWLNGPYSLDGDDLIIEGVSDEQIKDAEAALGNADPEVQALLGAVADCIAKIRSDCAAAITAGIRVDVLGVVHSYPTSERDQQNLAAQVLAAQVHRSVRAPYKFWCADLAGVWARRDHSAEQILRLGEAVRAHVSRCQDRYESLMQQLDALQVALDDPAQPNPSQAEIEAVKW